MLGNWAVLAYAIYIARALPQAETTTAPASAITGALTLTESTPIVTGPRDVGDRGRRGKIGVTGPGKRIARISGIGASGEAGNYQGCTIV